MSDASSGRGKRLAQARRLLGVVLQRDVTQSVAAEMVGTTGASWSRWESEKDRPKAENLLAFVKILRDHGLPEITASWLEFGEGSGPPQIGHAPAQKRRAIQEPEKPVPHPSTRKAARRRGA